MERRVLNIEFDNNLNVVGDVVIGRLTKADAYSCDIQVKVPKTIADPLVDNCYLMFEMQDGNYSTKCPKGLNAEFTNLDSDFVTTTITLDSYASQLAGNCKISLVIKKKDESNTQTLVSSLFFIYFRDSTERNRMIALEDYDDVVLEIQTKIDELDVKALEFASKTYVNENIAAIFENENTWRDVQTFAGGMELPSTYTFTNAGVINSVNGQVFVKVPTSSDPNFQLEAVNVRYLTSRIAELTHGNVTFTNIDVQGGSIKADLSGSTIHQMKPNDEESAANVGYINGIKTALESAISDALQDAKDYHDNNAKKHIKDIGFTYNQNNGHIALTIMYEDSTYNTTKEIDLPTELSFVAGAYNPEAKTIVLTMAKGSSVSIPLGALVSGLVSESQFEEWKTDIDVAESNRESNEATRESNEETRKINELDRQAKESARVTAENLRVSNEENRTNYMTNVVEPKVAEINTKITEINNKIGDFAGASYKTQAEYDSISDKGERLYFVEVGE